MSGLDVRDLAGDSLQRGDFPAGRRSDFRVYFDPAAREKAHAHARADDSVEICGVLVGRLLADDDGPFALVEDCICCNSATSKFAEVTFTHESWAQINEAMDSTFADKQIVGWYHSHPSFGIFLSDRDRFIHEHFFSGAGQVAYVVDPVRKEEGVFAWRDGEPRIMDYYWVGEALQSSTPRDDSPAERRPEKAGPVEAPAAPPRREPWWAWGLPFALLGCVAFLLGTYSGRTTTAWERQRLVDGVVAHYGYNKLTRIGLRDDLDILSSNLEKLADAVDAAQKAGGADSERSEEQAAEQRRLIAGGFRDAIRGLDRIGQAYGYDQYERQALALLVAQKQAELNRALAQQYETPAPKKAAPPASQDQPTQDQETTPPEAAPAAPEAVDPAPEASDPASGEQQDVVEESETEANETIATPDES